MIKITETEDGDFDLDCTIEEFDRIKVLVSAARKNHADISELRNLHQHELTDLEEELAQFHDVPVPLEQRYAYLLSVVIDAMRPRIVGGMSDEDRHSIVRQFDAIDWPQSSKS
ncbi:hypothetical protein [Algicella marina]|uniref:Uncharacterized protein n=1 Tax=Algicella marina TaxID=2683284 RepID=A0A6P1T0C7_9RHOB|nr:hypothetical protein [Algicella marina]QHQ35225.1 hypothetical protein GO499_08440 [Algicella marina]